MTNSDTQSETIESLQKILDGLREETGAGRTTVRLDYPGLGFHVDTVAAESLSEGVHSIRPHNALDQRNAAAVKWLQQNMRTFIMEDCLNPWDPAVAPEDEVIKTYGIRSEMVAPVVSSEDLVGWVSVHYTKGPRAWTEKEIGRLETACRHVSEVVQRATSL